MAFRPLSSAVGHLSRHRSVKQFFTRGVAISHICPRRSGERSPAVRPVLRFVVRVGPGALSAGTIVTECSGNRRPSRCLARVRPKPTPSSPDCRFLYCSAIRRPSSVRPRNERAPPSSAWRSHGRCALTYTNGHRTTARATALRRGEGRHSANLVQVRQKAPPQVTDLFTVSSTSRANTGLPLGPEEDDGLLGRRPARGMDRVVLVSLFSSCGPTAARRSSPLRGHGP